MAAFSHISGAPMLDLINTVQWRLGGPEREEDLVSFASVSAWCVETGLLDLDEHALLETLADASLCDAERELDVVIQAREAAYRAMFERDAQAAQSIAALYRESLRVAHLALDGSQWIWKDDGLTLRSPRDRIVRGLNDLLARDDLDLLNQCADVACGWVFLDTSPRRNRRWCVASDCGDRNRARAYYARHKHTKARAAKPSEGLSPLKAVPSKHSSDPGLESR